MFLNKLTIIRQNDKYPDIKEKRVIFNKKVKNYAKTS
jgi:hypothetical protein